MHGAALVVLTPMDSFLISSEARVPRLDVKVQLTLHDQKEPQSGANILESAIDRDAFGFLIITL